MTSWDTTEQAVDNFAKKLRDALDDGEVGQA
jgi:hypothetical protein